MGKMEMITSDGEMVDQIALFLSNQGILPNRNVYNLRMFNNVAMFKPSDNIYTREVCMTWLNATVDIRDTLDYLHSIYAPDSTSSIDSEVLYVLVFTSPLTAIYSMRLSDATVTSLIKTNVLVLNTPGIHICNRSINSWHLHTIPSSLSLEQDRLLLHNYIYNRRTNTDEDRAPIEHVRYYKVSDPLSSLGLNYVHCIYKVYREQGDNYNTLLYILVDGNSANAFKIV